MQKFKESLQSEKENKMVKKRSLFDDEDEEKEEKKEKGESPTKK